MWLRWHPDEAITQHNTWPPPGSISIPHLKHQWTAGKLIQLSLITTPTQWRLAVHCGYRTQLTGAVSRRKRSESTPISPMWHTTYSLSYHMVSEWIAVFLLAKHYRVEVVKPHRRDPSPKGCCNAFCSSQQEDISRRWPRIGYIEYRKRLGNEETGGAQDIALNGEGSWSFGDVVGQPKHTCSKEIISHS